MRFFEWYHRGPAERISQPGASLVLTRLVPLLLLFYVYDGILPERIFAAEDRSTAFVTRVEGDVKVFANPSPTAPKTDKKEATPVLKFDGKFFTEKPVKRGTKIGPGELIKTGANGKARLIFRNGDQVTVSENTAYRMSEQTGGKSMLMGIIFGDARSVILPDGPRANMKVQTRSMSMGVRGTDFHVKAWTGTGGSEVTVIRGAVVVERQAEGPASPAPMEVKAGQSAVIKAPPPAARPEVSAEAIVVKQTTQQELVRIQKATTVTQPPPSPQAATEAKSPDSPVSEDLEKLEEKAVENVMSDIKRYDPKAYEAIQAKVAEDMGKIVDVDAVNSVSVGKLFDDAPVDASMPKVQKKDLQMKGDVYDQYQWKK